MMIDAAGLEAGDSCPVCENTDYGESQKAICTAVSGNLMCRVCSNTFVNHGNTGDK